MFVEKRKENVILKLLIAGRDFRIASVQVVTKHCKIRLNAMLVLFRNYNIKFRVK
jgi:hypothetical protein